MPSGNTIKIKGFALKAPVMLHCNMSIKAVVNPQPGHSILNIVFHRHGISILISNAIFKNSEITK